MKYQLQLYGPPFVCSPCYSYPWQALELVSYLDIIWSLEYLQLHWL